MNKNHHPKICLEKISSKKRSQMQSDYQKNPIKIDKSHSGLGNFHLSSGSQLEVERAKTLGCNKIQDMGERVEESSNRREVEGAGGGGGGCHDVNESIMTSNINANKNRVTRSKSVVIRNNRNKVNNNNNNDNDNNLDRKRRSVQIINKNSNSRSKYDDEYSKRSQKYIESRQSSVYKRSDVYEPKMYFYINDNYKNKKYHLKNNLISTTKYNILTFIPKSLIIQFMRLSNIYFLITAIIQSIPIISPLTSITAIVPLIFVLGVSMIRELIEDLVRNKYDRTNNDEEVIVFRDGIFVEDKSSTLRPGEIILLFENKRVPADMVVLDTGSNSGGCYVETSSLDGEKTLKLKACNKKTYGILSEFFVLDGDEDEHAYRYINGLKFKGEIKVDKPNANLNQIEGKITFNFIYQNEIEDENYSICDSFEFTSECFLLKSSLLKNTNWILGVIIYTGMNNKIILNSKKPRTKISQIEQSLNYFLIFVLIFLLICCLILAILNKITYQQKQKFFINFIMEKLSPSLESFIDFFTYFLLLNTLIPISLVVTIEIIKMAQGLFIQWDINLYSQENKHFCRAKSVSINEELGSVNFIFSDKTGTLTMNKLEFKYCLIGEECYKKKIENIDNDEDSEIKNNSKNLLENIKITCSFGEYFFCDYEKNMRKLVKNNNKIMTLTQISDKVNPEKINLINEYWTALTLTNECMVSRDKMGLIKYIGIFPDDLELVKISSNQGYKLIDTSLGKKIIKIEGGKIMEYQILKVLGFSSERKRMSIIVKEESTGQIVIYTKGADTEITKRLSNKSLKSDIYKTVTYNLETFSRCGLRTLMVAYRKISEEEYMNWHNELHNSEKNENSQNERIYEKIEKNFELIGGTVVEDKLQNGVPETIKQLLMADIKIWVLTGDKKETVESVGLSCNLINNDHKIFKLFVIENEEKAKIDCSEEIFTFFEEFQKYLNELSIKHNRTLNKNMSMNLNFDGEEKKNINNYNNNNINNNNHNNNYSKRYGSNASNVNSEYEVDFNLLNKLKQQKLLDPFSIIIESPILCGLFKNEELTNDFLKIGQLARTVICCRVSPFQKSQVVKKMKEFDKNAITLAIGDGNNDVSMIMEANVGIGIFGEEGTGAAQASDFAIGEFRLLKRLLFYHGRNNLNRISKMILYFFYKNFIFTMTQFFFAFNCLFSGQTLIDDWYITCYNLIFTAFPLCISALTDTDIQEEDGSIIKSKLPLFYKESREGGRIFSPKNFILTLLKSTILAGIICYLCTYNEILDNKGYYSNIWYISLKNYVSILVVVSLNILITANYLVILLPIIVLVTTFILFLIFLVLVHYGLIFQFNSKASIESSMSGILFYFSIFLLGALGATLDYSFKIYVIYFQNSLYAQLERNRRKKLREKYENGGKKLPNGQININNCNNCDYECGIVERKSNNIVHNNNGRIILDKSIDKGFFKNGIPDDSGNSKYKFINLKNDRVLERINERINIYDNNNNNRYIIHNNIIDVSNIHGEFSNEVS